MATTNIVDKDGNTIAKHQTQQCHLTDISEVHGHYLEQQ